MEEQQSLSQFTDTSEEEFLTATAKKGVINKTQQCLETQGSMKRSKRRWTNIKT